MKIDMCKIFHLPRIKNRLGDLTFIEKNRHIPFEIKRVYYIYNIPQGAQRGGHAHKELHQLIIPISGSFDIHLDDGFSKKTVHLSQSFDGLYICPMIWRSINNFSSGAVCMVLASNYYDENDYYRDYDSFLTEIKK